MHDTNTFDGEVLRAALRETVRDLGARR